MSTITILAISGSLRKHSFSTSLLHAAAALVPEHVNFIIYDGLGNLPHFNPDLDGEQPPAPVHLLREQLRAVDGVIVCTPEYANGVPGVLKNGLDWIVSSGELMRKPVAAISASPYPTGGEKALASLMLTLTMMSAVLAEETTMSIPFVLRKVNSDAHITDDETEQALRNLIHSLLNTIRTYALRA